MRALVFARFETCMYTRSRVYEFFLSGCGDQMSDDGTDTLNVGGVCCCFVVLLAFFVCFEFGRGGGTLSIAFAMAYLHYLIVR